VYRSVQFVLGDVESPLVVRSCEGVAAVAFS